MLEKNMTHFFSRKIAYLHNGGSHFFTQAFILMGAIGLKLQELVLPISNCLPWWGSPEKSVPGNRAFRDPA